MVNTIMEGLDVCTSDTLRMVLYLNDHPSLTFDLLPDTSYLVGSDEPDQFSGSGIDGSGDSLSVWPLGVNGESNTGCVSQMHEDIFPEKDTISLRTDSGILASPGWAQEPQAISTRSSRTRVCGGLKLILTSEDICLDVENIPSKLVCLPVSIVDWLCMGEGSHTYDFFTDVIALVSLSQLAGGSPKGAILRENLGSLTDSVGQSSGECGESGALVLSTGVQDESLWREFVEVNHLKLIQL